MRVSAPGSHLLAPAAVAAPCHWPARRAAAAGPWAAADAAARARRRAPATARPAAAPAPAPGPARAPRPRAAGPAAARTDWRAPARSGGAPGRRARSALASAVASTPAGTCVSAGAPARAPAGVLHSPRAQPCQKHERSTAGQAAGRQPLVGRAAAGRAALRASRGARVWARALPVGAAPPTGLVRDRPG